MNIEDVVKKSLMRGLSSLKFQSIGKCCKSLVKSFLGKKDAEQFYKLYDYISQLVHSGGLKNDQQELYNISEQSYILAKKLLVAYLKNISENPKYSD